MKVVQFVTDYSPTTITKYESSKTGLSSIVVDRKGPKLNGYFALATEILDDSGAPHTLEHLVFMGSKNYRYKGVLDKLANRAYSHTNAWTATDHTAYKLDTAGWEGFAQILPVYLEHILRPTITDAACYTEVHHVDGAGHDAGVVYSEMQGVENKSESLMNLRACRLLYPEEVGFRYETGGMTKALRVLTTERIRAFHKEMYQLQNLCVIVIGEVDHSDLLRILEEFEGSILEHLPNIPMKRPWIDSAPVPPLTRSIVDTVEFPEKDESMGEISIAWLGPHCSDLQSSIALEILSTYLAGSSASVLEKHFVEIKEPLASSVNFYTEERPDTVIWINLSSVPSKKLAEVEREMIDVLKKTAGSPLDMDYMKECLSRTKRKLKFHADLSGDYFSTTIITDFLFGNRDGSTLQQIKDLKTYEQLAKWGDKDWRGFLSEWISDAHHVSVLGQPSAGLAKKLKEDEKARIEERKEKLGEAGLRELAQRLEDAKAQNDVPIPKEVIERFKIPEVDSIHFIETLSARAGLAKKDGPLNNRIQNLLDSAPATSTIPLYLHYEHVPTEFVHVNLILSTSQIPIELRPLLSVYIQNFFDTPVMKDGKLIEFEKVVPILESFTVKYKITIGDRLGVGETIHLKFQIEPEQYQRTIQWIKTLFWDSIFDKNRIEVAVSKLLQDIPEEKRSGDNMAYSVSVQITESLESIGRATDTLVKASYLKRIAKLLQADEKKVLSQLELVRVSLCRLENMRIFVIANVEKLPNLVTAWAEFVEGRTTTGKIVDLDSKSKRLSLVGQNPGNVCQIVPLPSIDSSYSTHITKGPTSLLDPTLPALILALAYLQTTEGPLWVGVRGTGLAYGAHFSRNTDAGQLIFDIYRAPDAYKAFAVAKDVIKGYIEGTTPFDPHLLEGALSSIVVRFAESEADMAAAGTQSFINQVIRGVGPEWNSILLKKVKGVTEDDLRTVLRDVVMGCFEKERSVTVCVVAEGKVENVKSGFENAGFTVKVDKLEKFQHSYGLEVDGVIDTKEEAREDGSDEDENEDSWSGEESGEESEED
ncbi:cytoplasm protein [Kalaharituber pfeilii]|nr:cytoplasm protein [Kalaharituber pfeilii]